MPNVRAADDILKARRPTQFPPAGDRSLFGPMRAHQNEGVLVHILRADRKFRRCQKAPAESWNHLLELDFHVAVLGAVRVGGVQRFETAGIRAADFIRVGR